MLRRKYLQIGGAGLLPDLNKERPFKSIVVIEQVVPPQRQREISKWLVESGCLYMMAWGIDCSSWDDSVDYANLELHDYGDIPEREVVQTTWHDKETLSDVMAFAKQYAPGTDRPVDRLSPRRTYKGKRNPNEGAAGEAVD